MKISSTQKVIKVGSSLAVTIPAKEAKASNLKVGSEVNISVEPVIKNPIITNEYELFKSKYSQTLKNLATK